MKKQYTYVCAAALLALTSLPAHSQAPAAPASPTTTTVIALATLPPASGLTPAATLASTQNAYSEMPGEMGKKRRKKSGKTVFIVIGVAVALGLLRILL